MKATSVVLSVVSTIISIVFAITVLHKLEGLHACPKCMPEEEPSWVLLNERPLSKVAEVMWKSELEGVEGPVTSVRLEDGSKFLVKGLWSVEAGRTAAIQDWWNSKRRDSREVKRCIRFDNQATSKWIVE